METFLELIIKFNIDFNQNFAYLNLAAGNSAYQYPLKESKMITPIDVICMQIIDAEKRVDRAHYHLANPPLPHPRSPMEEATFHLVDRAISYDQIGFDYYANVVTYRI